MFRVIRVVNGDRIFGTIGCQTDVPNTLIPIDPVFLVRSKIEDEVPLVTQLVVTQLVVSTFCVEQRFWRCLCCCTGKARTSLIPARGTHVTRGTSGP